MVAVDDHQLSAVRHAVRFCFVNLDWDVEDKGAEGEREWVVLRTGTHEAFLRPFDRFVEF